MSCIFEEFRRKQEKHERDFGCMGITKKKTQQEEYNMGWITLHTNPSFGN